MKKMIICLLCSVSLLVSVQVGKAWTGTEDLGIVYVSQTGSNEYPYDSLEKACTDLLSLSGLQCKEIVVDDGIYYMPQISSLFWFPTKIHSINGAESTIIDFGGKGGVSFNRCTVDGFTFQNGGQKNIAVYGDYSLFQNCIFRDCSDGSTGSGAFSMSNESLLYNCLMYGNNGRYNALCYSSFIINSTILGNSNSNAFWVFDGHTEEIQYSAIYNSIIMPYVNGAAEYGVNLRVCYNSIVSDYAEMNLSNCIITNDPGVIVTTNNITVGLKSVNNTVEVSLTNTSCAIDVGMNLVQNENGTDLYGYERIVNTVVDVGCVEFGASEKIQTIATKGSSKKKILVMWKKDRKGRNVRWEIYRGDVNDLSSAKLVSQINNRNRNHWEDRDINIKPGETYYYWIKKIIIDTSMKAVDEVSDDILDSDSGYIQALNTGLLIRAGKSIYSTGENIEVGISLFPGAYAGQIMDWWVLVNIDGTDCWYELDRDLNWVPIKNQPVLQTGLFQLDLCKIWKWPLSVGVYTFYFGVDAPNGTLDSDIVYDSVTVEVR